MQTEQQQQQQQQQIIEVSSLMFSSGHEETCALTKEPVKYGELVVLG